MINSDRWYFSMNWGEEYGMIFKWYPTFYWTNTHRCIHWMWGFIGWER